MRTLSLSTRIAQHAKGDLLTIRAALALRDPFRCPPLDFRLQCELLLSSQPPQRHLHHNDWTSRSAS